MLELFWKRCAAIWGEISSDSPSSVSCKQSFSQIITVSFVIRCVEQWMLIFCDRTSSGPQVFESKGRITEKVKLFKEKASYRRYFPWLLTTAIHAVAQNFLTWFLHLSSLKRAARRRWFALKSCWNSNVRCNCVRAVFCIVFRASRSQNPVVVLTRAPFEFCSETRAYAHAHTHLLYPLAFAQRSSCHSNTKLSELPSKHRHGAF